MYLPNNTLLQGGKYRIDSFIGSGGFGCTYKATHIMLNRTVAIKEFFVKDFCNRDEATHSVTVGTQTKVELVAKLKKKFIDEATSLASLKHPNIVSVSDIFEENGTAYFVMDYIDGKSLSEIISEKGSLAEAVAVKYIKQICDALSCVHSHNRLHLDIKPANIMIGNDGRATLIDFGASKQYDEVNGENTSTLIGKTPGYAPIEQLGNNVQSFTPATDIYSLGATLYKCLTGNTPPDATTIVSDGLPSLPACLSPEIARAIESAMQVNKTKRPQTIGEFVALLNGASSTASTTSVPKQTTKQSAQSEETIVAGAVKPTQTTTRNNKAKVNDEKKSNAGWIVGVILGLIAVFGGAMVFMVQDRIETEKRARIEEERQANEEAERQANAEAEQRKAVLDDLYAQLSAITHAIPKSNTAESQESVMESIRALASKFKEVEYQLSAEESEVFKAEFNAMIVSFQAHLDYQQNQGIQEEQKKTTVTKGTHNGHQWVDLGLPSGTKWATCNVGANSPEEYGDYYAWGETSSKNIYEEDNSKWWRVSYSVLKSKGVIDANGNLTETYDVAAVKWGGNWRMPTKSEIKELSKLKNKEVEINGVKGIKIIGNNGNTLFLPFAGYCYEKFGRQGEFGNFWSATAYKDDWNAYVMDLKSLQSLIRYVGWSVRPVCR